MSRRAWEEARYLPGLEDAKHLESWPDAFTPSELAALQYPDVADRSRRNAMSASMRKAIEKGEIETITVDRIYTEKYQPSDAPRGHLKYLLFNRPKPFSTQGLIREAYAKWMAQEGFGVGNEQERPSRFVLVWLGSKWVPVPSKDGRVTGKREKQIAAIVETARDFFGYDPMDIPVGGKAKIKAYCLEHLRNSFTDEGFEHAWDAAKKQQRARIHDKERFMS